MKARIAQHHHDWMTLVESSGVFLTLPVLKDAFPNGMPQVDRDIRTAVRDQLAEVAAVVAAPKSTAGDIADARRRWLQFVLRELLAYDTGKRLREGAGVPTSLTIPVAEHATTLRPEFALIEPAEGGPGRVRLIVLTWPWRTELERRPARDEHGRPTRWSASPIDRAATACRQSGVPLALVTDTDRFALVWAPRQGPSGYAIFPGNLFGEERTLLDAFVQILGIGRFFSADEAHTLEGLYKASADNQHEVTDQLGAQVRQAVELLIGAISRAHRASRGTLLDGIRPSDVYEAAVTVLMRLVVLLSAEERRLLPADDDLYSESYAISSLRAQLEEERQQTSEDVLEKRSTAWHRILALGRAVHGGIRHERLSMPAYGGSLFDPSRYLFLDHVPVDDRTVLAMLDALQRLTFRDRGVTEARNLSYRNLDVEQIGHVYEGLLDHGCRPASEIVVGLIGKRGQEPEVPLRELQAQLAKGDDAFAEWLAERGGPSASKAKKLLYEALDAAADARLRAACDNDNAIVSEVAPFAGLLRKDLRDLPMVILEGALYVTQTSQRRDSGTAYTTKELADEVVRYALEPLVYSPGPPETADASLWKLKSRDEILALKVCDPAVGSGAILVAACRYLADRLVEADDSLHTLNGEGESRTVLARRAIVDHCLYGVDRNPMAVEMAKLSLWLTTLAKDRPFTFLDHQVRCGDSLLGITHLEQVRRLHIRPDGADSTPMLVEELDAARVVDPLVGDALRAATSLMSIDVMTMRDVEQKSRLHEEMATALERLTLLADLVVGSALETAGRPIEAFERRIAEQRSTVRQAFARTTDATVDAAQRDNALETLREAADYALDTDNPAGAAPRRCLHWPLAFPEVFLAEGRTGFDAFVGNPPFLGGQRLTGAMGTAFRNYCVAVIAEGARGSADLVAYFFLRVFGLLNHEGACGLLATNTIAQGGTREVGLDRLVLGGASIVRGVSSEPWPGLAALEIAKVWLRKGTWRGRFVLGGNDVRAITPMLTVPGRAEGRPHRLAANAGKSFQGSIVLGLGFVMTPEQAQELIAKDERNRDVLFPYMNGEDLNSRPDQSASRWVINFRDWPLERTGDGSWSSGSNKERDLWLKVGRVPRDYPDPVSADYPDCLSIVERLVRPERATQSDEGGRRLWWRFLRPRPELYDAIAGSDAVLVRARIANRHSVVNVATNIVFNEKTVAFPNVPFALVQSGIHEEWAREFSSTLKTDLQYTPSDCFETFPFPAHSDELEGVGRRYYDHRDELMLSRSEGLTKTYNRFHRFNETANDIVVLRQLHVEMDHAVARAYGWSELDLEHGFHGSKWGVRYTVSPAARREILDRLLELNHERWAAEQATRGQSGDAPKKSVGRQKKGQMGLF